LLCGTDFRVAGFGLARVGLALFDVTRFGLATFGVSNLADLTARIRGDRGISGFGSRYLAGHIRDRAPLVRPLNSIVSAALSRTQWIPVPAQEKRRRR
jgi:hypothetical protein